MRVCVSAMITQHRKVLQCQKHAVFWLPCGVQNNAKNTNFIVLILKFLVRVRAQTRKYNKINFIYRNALVEYMLNGTAIKEAMDNGKNMKSRECDAIYPGCPLDRTTVNNMLTKMLPKQGN